MQTEFIDRIYECSVVPEMWPGVLDDLSAMSDSCGGLLFSARKVLHWTASETVREVFADYVNDGWFTRCSRRLCILSADEPGFFTEQDFWSEDQISADPIYRDFFRPRGLGWSAGTGVRIPSGDNIVFSIERSFSSGPMEPKHVELLNALRPHLARSALISARLGLQRAAGAAEALTGIRLPALVLDEAGQVVQVNPMMETQIATLGDTIRIGAGNRIVLANRAANAQLAERLAALGTPNAVASCSLPLRNAEGAPVGVLHLLPLRRTAHDIFDRGYTLMVVTPLRSERSPSVDVLRSLFDLTRSEARVAGGLAAGKTVDDIAADGDVAVSTVRSQVRRVLDKTGCTRQAEVASLLAGLALGTN